MMILNVRPFRNPLDGLAENYCRNPDGSAAVGNIALKLIVTIQSLHLFNLKYNLYNLKTNRSERLEMHSRN